MTTLDDRARATALRLIDKFGKPVTFTSVSAGAYDPTTGSAVSTNTSTSIKVLIEAFSLRSAMSGFDSGLVKTGDKKFTAAAKGMPQPNPGDTLTVDGVVWNIVGFQEIWSGEQVALFEMQGRI